MAKHLEDDAKLKLNGILKLRMVHYPENHLRTEGWEYHPGWNASRIAEVEGYPYTKSNVNHYRNLHFHKPERFSPVQHALPFTQVVLPPPPRDAREIVETYFGRIEQLSSDLAIHRSNTTDAFAEVMTELLTIRQQVTALVKAWGITAP